MRPDRQFLLKHPAHFLALGFGAGLATRAPGTWGTLVALPIYLLANALGGASAVLLLAGIFFLVGGGAAAVPGRAPGGARPSSRFMVENPPFLQGVGFAPPGGARGGGGFFVFPPVRVLQPL